MPAGRPKTKYDLDQVELFGRFRATYKTMADWFGVCEKTIKREMTNVDGEFCPRYKKGMADLKLTLSEAQIETALVDKVPSMQIWLGKQYLGQRDKQEVDNNHKITTVNVVEKFE